MLHSVFLVVLAVVFLELSKAVQSGDRNAVKFPSLELQQIAHGVSEKHDATLRVKRKIYQFEIHGHKKWSLPIKYMIHSSLRTTNVGGKSATTLINQVIREDFEANTCIEFQLIARPPLLSEQYILFRKSSTSSTCQASIGMGDNTQTFHGQPIYLGEACFELRKALAYTIGSTLGLLNEMNRPDRQKYVDVNFDNIEPDEMFNFARHSSDYFTTLDLPYDFGSVMHAQPNRGLKQGIRNRTESALTAIPKDKRLVYVPGQMSEISFYDLFAINQVYCNGTCRARIPCHHGGYQNPKSCGACKCPDGYGGTYCEQIKDGADGCTPSSGKLRVQDTRQCVQSPQFDAVTRHYDSGDDCAWQLMAPPGRLIDLWFEYLRLPSSPMSVYATCLHWVEIKYKGISQTRGARYCKDVNRARLKPGFLPEAVVPMSKADMLTTEANEILLIFRSPDYFEPNIPERRGFRLCYKISDKIPTVDEPQATKQKDKTNYDRRYIYIAAAVGLLILILILCACVCLIVVMSKRKKPPARTTDTGFQARTTSTTIVLSDIAVEEAIAKKNQEAMVDSLEGIVNPAMIDTFQPPTYTEHDPPPKYATDPWGEDASEDAGGDTAYDNPLYKNT